MNISRKTRDRWKASRQRMLAKRAKRRQIIKQLKKDAKDRYEKRLEKNAERHKGDLPATIAKDSRKGIGLCDECAQPKPGQQYIGYGIMLCPDC